MSILEAVWYKVQFWHLMWRLRRYARWRVKETLRTQGFLVYCTCRHDSVNPYGLPDIPLNIRPSTDSPEEGIYTWVCPCCGKATSFDVTPPVPIKVGAS
jgi:hypothetical protein